MEKPAFLVDIGAPKTVSGKNAVNKLLFYFGFYKFRKLRPSSKRFRFANESFKSLGSIMVYLDTPGGVEPIPVEVDIVPADILPLLGLDVRDRERLTPDIAFNVLSKR